MKALFISNDPSIFNPDSGTRARMKEYSRAIGELHILSAAPITAKPAQDESLFLHPIVAPKLFRVSTLARHARRIILKRNIDVVSAQDPFEHGLAALKAVTGTQAKLHIQVHTDFLSPWFIRAGNWRSPHVRMPFLNRFRRSLADRVLPKAQGIRAVSERIKQSLLARYGSTIPEPSVIPIATPAVLPEAVPLPQHPFTFILMTIGRLEPEKRIEDILAALKLVLPQYPMVGLMVVGEGRERGRLEGMAHALKISGSVMFLGNRPDAQALLPHAHAYIQASAYEGYSRTLIEAALARVPIITTDVGIVGEVFKGYEDVLAVPVADPTALSLAIVGLLEDTAVRQSFMIHAEEAAQVHLASMGDVPARIAADLAKALV